MLSSLSASASRVAATGANTALYNFEIVFLKNEADNSKENHTSQIEEKNEKNE